MAKQVRQKGNFYPQKQNNFDQDQEMAFFNLQIRLKEGGGIREPRNHNMTKKS